MAIFGEIDVFLQYFLPGQGATGKILHFYRIALGLQRTQGGQPQRERVRRQRGQTPAHARPAGSRARAAAAPAHGCFHMQPRGRQPALPPMAASTYRLRGRQLPPRAPHSRTRAPATRLNAQASLPAARRKERIVPAYRPRERVLSAAEENKGDYTGRMVHNREICVFILIL
ncbi:hypothetical protein ABD76_20210 [Paenibacillus dendritiformis]|nr:hypothetical protein [Paenibacillus dendritiformis]